MLDLWCLVKAATFTYKNDEATIQKLEERGVNYRVQGNGLVVLDSKGKASVLLETVAGDSINRSVISGSIAEGNGFEPDTNITYQCNIVEQKSNDYGRQFKFNNMGEVPARELRGMVKDYGAKNIINVDKAANDNPNPIEVEEEEVEQFG